MMNNIEYQLNKRDLEAYATGKKEVNCYLPGVRSTTKKESPLAAASRQYTRNDSTNADPEKVARLRQYGYSKE